GAGGGGPPPFVKKVFRGARPPRPLSRRRVSPPSHIHSSCPPPCDQASARMNYRFDWSVLWTGQSGQWLLSGLITTLELSACAWILAVALGVLSGAMRTAPIRL